MKGFFGETIPNSIISALFNAVEKPITDRYFFTFEVFFNFFNFKLTQTL